MDQELNMDSLQKMLGNGLTWVGMAFLLVMVLLFSTLRIGQVSGEEIGILLHRISGEIDIIEQSGAKIYNGMLSDFYKLDKTLQTLEMTEDVSRGDRRGKDDLKIKTMDGSDVFVDIKVQYKIIPELAKEVIAFSGPGDNYKKKWARDYIRALSRNYLGELTTEEFYDASKRDAKLVLARNDANKRLNRFGLNIDSIVIPTRPHFYKEYEDMIKKKKLADQAVLEERSKALAAKQRQATMIVQETNIKNVAVEQFTGQMQQKIIATEADAERGRKQADAYYEKRTIAAGAKLYQMEKTAEATLARKQAEADGIKALNAALQGKGGANMVKLEYARKLRHIQLEGKPFSVESHIDRFEHSQGAASTGRK